MGLHKARKQRNDLAHSATLPHQAAEECVTAMGFALTELAGIPLNTALGIWRQLAL